MTFWQRWLRQPRTLFLRKACFQVHLWIGLAIGLYVVVLSLTGSALVFRNELNRAFSPKGPAVDRTARIQSLEELTEAARHSYPNFVVARVGDVQQRSPVVQISLRREGETIERVFNAYTGEDLGDPFPMAARALLWVAVIHDDLLMVEGQRGRVWNGIGSILTVLLCLTGAIVWWPGSAGWRRGVVFKWRSGWPRFSFDLHSTFGFWCFVPILIWAVSGLYLSMPTPFMAIVDWIVEPSNQIRPVDVALEWLARLHFGRWQSYTLKTVWVIIGLIPAVMFVTGVIMWWNRVVRKSLATRARQPALDL